MLDSLPFQLTSGQGSVINEIFSDLRHEKPMMRLLQGDVGSGKTVVALAAILYAVEAGFVAALMAPTDILATQHYNWILKVSEPLGLKVALLTGKTKGKERKEILLSVKNGEIHIVIGTHALFQESVEFYNLGLVVIDEQHRFGVKQRLALVHKSSKPPNMLVMSATPIPRTITLTYYGDMELSQLTEKPAERLRVHTSVMAISKAGNLIESLGNVIGRNEKIYWVCPLIEESEHTEDTKFDLSAAITRYNELTARFGPIVGLLHGKMKQVDKDQVMFDFISGKLKLLVATTVIEVGIDVPDATTIIIEHAERFGLAQLHQLRGRVGRSSLQSNCILLYGTMLSEAGRAKLQVMKETCDGFEIAKEDLKIRGAGDVLGTRQSGLPGFKFVDFAIHSHLAELARTTVKDLLYKDPELVGIEAQKLQLLLELFGYHHHGELINSG